MIRSNICLNAHPAGCEAMVKAWIDRSVKAKPELATAARAGGKNTPQTVLVLGCSTGYGLASRVTAAFSCGARTVGVSLDQEPTEVKPGTPGWYGNRAFDAAAAGKSLYAVTFNADAFADGTREKVIALAKADGLRFDQVIYSLASPVRVDPATGIMHRSVLKASRLPAAPSTW
jgi:enoyl-[acyl-carrier protein] reductase/trans-2-enoyl-CoA reductase (NAD+)